MRAGLGWHRVQQHSVPRNCKRKVTMSEVRQHMWIRREADLDPWFSSFPFVCTILFYFLGDLCSWVKKNDLLKIYIHQVRKRKERRRRERKSEKEGAWKTAESKHKDGHSLLSIRPKSFVVLTQTYFSWGSSLTTCLFLCSDPYARKRAGAQAQ